MTHCHDQHAQDETTADRTAAEPDHAAHRGHGLMMLLCCIPMVIVAGGLVATGSLTVGFLLPALACAGMMWAMMRLMDSDRKDR
jgi:hypothetical protein